MIRLSASQIVIHLDSGQRMSNLPSLLVQTHGIENVTHVVFNNLGSYAVCHAIRSTTHDIPERCDLDH